MAGALALAALGGCASLTDTNQQVVMLQTIQDNREITGAGCVLANDSGRWFVTSPGRVTIQRSPSDLWIDCKKGGASIGHQIFASTLKPLNLVGNVVGSAGFGYFVDRDTGAGYDYPATLTVLMRKPDAPVEPNASGSTGNVVY